MAIVLGAALAGCSKDDPAAPVASSLPPSTAAPSKKVIRFVIEPSGTATFDMKAPLENIKGLVKVSSGDFEIDPYDLEQSRGSVALDVSTLETHTFGEDAKDASQSEHARTWLEVGKANMKEQHRLARFAIRKIDAVSDKNVMQMQGDSRSVTVTASGDFLLHGAKQEKTVELTLIFTFVGDTPTSVTVKSKKPMAVNLKAHDIKARGDKGEEIVAKTLELFGTKVAEEASVTFELTAKPTGPAQAAPAAPSAAP
jgi:polyisoprenoid-binding protein YceI